MKSDESWLKDTPYSYFTMIKWVWLTLALSALKIKIA